MTEMLTFLPQPRHLESRSGSFSVDAGARIQVGPDVSDATRHTARGLQQALIELTGLTLEIVPTVAPATQNAISLVLVGRDDASLPPGELGLEWATEPGDQGYTLRVGEESAVVAASTEAGLFYGVQTLIQLGQLAGRRWPGLAIDDRP